MTRPRPAAKPAKRSLGATTVDEYLAAAPPDARAALLKLRGAIRAAAPKATEVIRHRMPTFKHRGGLVAFAAFKDHCSFFLMGTAVMAAHKRELTNCDTARGTIRFSADKPLPAALVKKLVKARIKENEARAKTRARST